MTDERNSGPSGLRPDGDGPGGDRFWDEAMLVAYVDGELDAADSRRLEALLAQNPEARAKVELMRRSADAVRGAYDEAMSVPLPAGLAALLAEDRGPAGGPAQRKAALLSLRHRREETEPRPGLAWRLLPLAASLLLLALGFAGGMAWRDIGASSSLRLATGRSADPGAQAYEAALAALLDKSSVGASQPYADAADGVAGQVTLLGDFTAKSGAACREFRHERSRPGASPVAEAGIACRRADGGWEILTLPTGRNG